MCQRRTVTSPETFEEIYTFFRDEEPSTAKIVPETRGLLRVSGRAITFPQNIAPKNATLQIYEINGATGARLDEQAEATMPIRADGAWGPFNARPRVNYEFAIVRAGQPVHHLYMEPFLRSDPWIRLLTSEPGGIGDLGEDGPNHAGLVILRYKEWWGDQGANSDILQINGVNILNAANTPQYKRAIATFVYDAKGDGATDLTAPIPTFAALPFLTGIDVFIPAADPPNATISIASTPRLGGGRVEMINVPNWASSKHQISVQFNDYLND